MHLWQIGQASETQAYGGHLFQPLCAFPASLYLPDMMHFQRVRLRRKEVEVDTDGVVTGIFRTLSLYYSKFIYKSQVQLVALKQEKLTSDDLIFAVVDEVTVFYMSKGGAVISELFGVTNEGEMSEIPAAIAPGRDSDT